MHSRVRLLLLPCMLLLRRAASASPSTPTLYIAANFHNNAATIPGFVTETGKLAQRYGPASLYVTVYESDSVDDTPRLLQEAGARFTAAGIGQNITTRGTLVRGPRSRIDFLADARNELLKPLRDMAPERVFDYVVFLNDVMFTAADVTQLLAVGGDVSCGTDFIPIGDANKIYRPPVDDGYPIFYDAWVARTLDGLPLRAMPPYMPPASVVATLKQVADMGLAFPDYTRVANMMELPIISQPEITQLQCCWNGVVVVRAAPFYRGLSFRSNLPGECAGSECSHFCADMWALNYTRFTMHHGVRVAYETETWERAKALTLPYTPVPLPFAFVDAHPPAVLCCGEHRIVRLPSYSRLTDESTPAFAYRVWTALTESPPDDDMLTALTNFVGNQTVMYTNTTHTTLSDEPRAPCAMEELKSVASRVCLSGVGRAIPRVLTQAGTADAREALIPYAASWKTLHPDHEYAFVDVDKDGDWVGVPIEVVSAVRRALNAGRISLAANVVRHALLYYRGGIVADLGTAVDESLSCVMADDDDLVQVFAAENGRAEPDKRRPSSSSHYRLIAVAATPHHPVALARLNTAMQRAGAGLGGDGMRIPPSDGQAFAADGSERHDNPRDAPRKLNIAARLSGMAVLVRGQGARIKHSLDPTVGV